MPLEESQCKRCGSSVTWVHCETCGGEGELEDEDGFGDSGECAVPCETCETCDGAGGWWLCLSSEKYCQANPLPGRENVERGEVEHFTIAPREFTLGG